MPTWDSLTDEEKEERFAEALCYIDWSAAVRILFETADENDCIDTVNSEIAKQQERKPYHRRG